MPRRCIRYHSLHHLGKDCKQPRERASSGERPAGRRIVRARRDGSSTPQGSAAEGQTPPHEPPPHLLESSEGPLSEFLDGAPPGHPATRPREAECFIQRDAATDTAETALQLALIAQPSGFAEGSTTSEVLLAVVAAAGVAADDVRVKKYYPEQFIIMCGSPAVRDQVLAASPVPFGNTPLVLLPWARLSHATLSTMQYKLTMDLEGMPPHVWREDIAAKLLAPYCWI